MNFLRYYFYYIILHLTLTGSSLLQIGDAISVNLDTSATYKHSSNILKSESDEKSDRIFIFSPGAVLNLGKRGTALDLSLKAKYDILQYGDYKDLDNNQLKLYLNGSYNPSELLNNSFSLSDVEGQIARSETGTSGNPELVERSTVTASFSSVYKYSPKLSFSFGLNQTDLTYDTHRDELSSKKSVTIPLKAIYQYSNKLSVVYGVTLNDTEVGQRKYGVINLPAYETDSVYYNVGLNGTILPKLTGQFDVGYRTLNFSTARSDYNAFGATSALTWTFSPKLRTTFNLSQDFDVAGSGSTYKFTRGNFSSVYSINSEYRLSINYGRTLKYFRRDRLNDLVSREDTLTNFSLNLHYVPSENYNFTAGYNYVKGVSDDINDYIDDYDLKEYRVSANFKY
jgi:hypothetical protein